jgi:hypothetical protein
MQECGFALKQNHHANTPWQMIHFSRCLDEPMKKVYIPRDSAKCLICSSREFALCMIVDEHPHIRELGLRRILKAKTRKSQSSSSAIQSADSELQLGLHRLVELE